MSLVKQRDFMEQKLESAFGVGGSGPSDLEKLEEAVHALKIKL
jgi:hypothetical protein